MIVVSRLNGSPIAINCDLIDFVDSEPVTTISLVDGSSFQVSESVEEVADRVREYRASVVFLAQQMDEETTHEPNLRVIYTEDSSNG